MVTVTSDGLYADGAPVELDAVAGAVNGRSAVLRVDRLVPTERLVAVMGVLADDGIEIRIEVEEAAHGRERP